MAISIVLYKGFELRAGAFEVTSHSGYVSSLLIARLVEAERPREPATADA